MDLVLLMQERLRKQQSAADNGGCVQRCRSRNTAFWLFYSSAVLMLFMALVSSQHPQSILVTMSPSLSSVMTPKAGKLPTSKDTPVSPTSSGGQSQANMSVIWLFYFLGNIIMVLALWVSSPPYTSMGTSTSCFIAHPNIGHHTPGGYAAVGVGTHARSAPGTVLGRSPVTFGCFLVTYVVAISSYAIAISTGAIETGMLALVAQSVVAFWYATPFVRTINLR